MTRSITVVGGGYAGLSFIRTLRARDRHVAITLVDQNPYHTMLVESHQVAAGSRRAESILLPFEQIDGFQFVQARVTGIDPQAKLLKTNAGELTYDRLVLALGSVDQDFGVPGVAEYGQKLRGLADAKAIAAQIASLPAVAPILIVGGGLTGVELAAHIALTRPQGRTLTLVEASPALLAGLPDHLARAARRRLGHLGVNVITGAAVSKVERDHAHLTDGTTLPFGLLIWAAGVRAHPLIATLGLPTDRGGRAIIGPDLSTPIPDLYVIGDAAAGHPPSAQAANQQGRALAEVLLGQTPAPLRIKGTLVDLGQHRGLGLLGNLTLQGLLPGFMKRVNEALWVYRLLGFRAALRNLIGLRYVA